MTNANAKYFVDYLPVTNTEDTELRLYVDGKDYFADLTNSLLQAKEWVFLTGLHFGPEFQLVRCSPNCIDWRFADLLLHIAKEKPNLKIYLLVNQFWEGEPILSTHRRIIRRLGGIGGYMGATIQLFKKLGNQKNIYCRSDVHPHNFALATNHQKTVVIDDNVAYLGGIDITNIDGDRWDTNKHTLESRHPNRPESFWHDIHMRVGAVGSKKFDTAEAQYRSNSQNPPGVVEFVRDNFVQRWKYGNLQKLGTYITVGGKFIPLSGVSNSSSAHIGLVNDREFPPTLPPFHLGKNVNWLYPKDLKKDETLNSAVQIVRSMPYSKNWFSEKPSWNKRKKLGWEKSCKEAYLIGIDTAQKYIYLENQWLADEDILKALLHAVKRNKSNPHFRIVVMLPYEPLTAAGYGREQNIDISSDIIKIFKESLKYNETFAIYSIRKKQPQNKWKSIYVHSKTLLIDDKWCLIGSANSGGISLHGLPPFGKDEPDTELSAIILDGDFAMNFRQRVWSEHLGRPVGTNYDPDDADAFRDQAVMRDSKIWFCTIFSKAFTKYILGRKFPHMKTSKQENLEELNITKLAKSSVIVSSFPQSQLYEYIIPSLLPATFSILVSGVPSGYELQYRWKFSLTVHIRTFHRLRAQRSNNVVEGKWSSANIVYIPPRLAVAIDRHISGLKRDALLGHISVEVRVSPINDFDRNRATVTPTARFTVKQRYDFSTIALARAKNNALILKYQESFSVYTDHVRRWLSVDSNRRSTD